MYDELERAAGAPARSGPSILGWIAVGLATVALMGAAGTYLTYRFVRNQVEDVVEQFEAVASARTPGGDPMVARTVSRALDELGLLPDEHVGPVASAMGRALAAPRRASDTRPRDAVDGEGVEGTFRLRTDEGEFTADLRADDQGGSFVVRGPDGEVVVDLSGDARGARLQVGVDGEVALIEAGADAGGPPRWVPVPDATRGAPDGIVSGRAGEATFGALTGTSPRDPEALVAEWRAGLEGDGWEVRAEHRLHGDVDGPSASAVARLPGSDRVVVLAAAREDSDTHLVLAWGEGLGDRP